MIESWAGAATAPSAQAPRTLSQQDKAIPWWLWMNVYSLDAVAVAVAWYILIAKSYGERTGPGIPAVLGCSVWVIYLLDHWIDAGSIPAMQCPLRKRVFRNHRKLILGFTTFLALSTAISAGYLLPPRVFLGGICVAVLVCGYLLAVHLLPARVRLLWPREAAVAALFAVGVAMPTWLAVRPVMPGFASALVLFFLLCWMNCSAVEVWGWDANGRSPEDTPDFLANWLADHLQAGAAGVTIIAGVLRGQILIERPIFLALGFSSLAFWAISIWRQTAKPGANEALLCTLLDVALLSPFLVLVTW